LPGPAQSGNCPLLSSSAILMNPAFHNAVHLERSPVPDSACNCLLRGARQMLPPRKVSRLTVKSYPQARTRLYTCLGEMTWI
ncbi:MAG TPA: hypothetical protein VMK12_30875, partial [Anaeromyxobacteraceae bacterium]|nr:hypothetical protein [Anaeromyxobacteraceae bacterium]